MNWLKNRWLNYFLFSLITIRGLAQQLPVSDSILHFEWKASWIAPSHKPLTGYGIFVFRKTISLPQVPRSFVIHVSADNRYKLFVNGKMVSTGPARGDIQHWNFETIDIAAFLQPGINAVAALVWNEGNYRPEAQLSLRTAFVLQGASDAEAIINTDSSWKWMQDSSYQPLPVNLPTYYVAGAGEQINMEQHLGNWENKDYQDENWQHAKETGHPVPKGVLGGYGTPSEWLLVPSSIPSMELSRLRMKSVRRADGITTPTDFPQQSSPLEIPANRTVTLLLDQSFLTNCYFNLIFSGGRNAAVSIVYGEALFSKFPSKGNRNEVEGKKIQGREDRLVSDGTARQQFTSLQWRTYRYVQLTIHTSDQPLTLDDCFGEFTGYPFVRTAKLESKNLFFDSLLETGWRTARLCAVETYMDCPYYERLQYIGDSRIQALVSLYNSGDDRLVKNALTLMDDSRLPEGVTESRHPSFTPQIIPTFSLWYIGMLHDYMMYGGDTNFVKDKLPGNDSD